MRVLGINASPHENGNTAYAVRYALSLLDKAGVETVCIALANKNIHACQGCFTCRNGKCVYDDDMGPIIAALRQCDALLLASPVYMGMVTGQMKTVMDRTVLLRVNRFELSGKIGGVLRVVGFGMGDKSSRCNACTLFFFSKTCLPSLMVHALAIPAQPLLEKQKRMTSGCRP